MIRVNYAILFILISSLCMGFSKHPVSLNVREKTVTPKVHIEKEYYTEKELKAREKKTGYNFTSEEKDLLARLIEAESGIESFKCKLAVGSVVINRLHTKDFPKTLKEVIYQREPSIQFSTTLRDNTGVAPIDAEPSEDSIKAVNYLVLNGTTLPKDILVFYAEYADDGWVTTRKTYTKIDHTVFAYSHK